MQLLRVPQAADTMGVSTKTVYRLIARGILRKVKIGGATRISKDELDAYLNQQFKKGAAHV
ncbi:MAG: helix-turn-helix domain-containing protein [Pontiella sp.]